MECNYAHQINICRLDSIVVLLPWSITINNGMENCNSYSIVCPPAMECNCAHQMNNCSLDVLLSQSNGVWLCTPNESMQTWCYYCLTAIECNYAHQTNNYRFDANVVPLPWSVTMHTKWTIASLMLLLSLCHGVLHTFQMDNRSLRVMVFPLPWSVTMDSKWTIAGLSLLRSHFHGVWQYTPYGQL